MVTRNFIKLSVMATAPILALSLPTKPAHAQSVLQQIEQEVSSIALKTRAAVVTIQEDVPIIGSITRFASPATIPIETLLLEDEVRQRTATLLQLQAEMVEMSRTYSDANPRMRDKKQEFEAEKKALQILRSRQAKTQQELAKKKAQEFELNLFQNHRRALETQQRLMQKLEDARVKLQKQISEGGRAVTLPSFITPNALQTAQPTNSYSRSGTGFSIGDGYIVTTADVLGGMIRPTVVTADGKRISGTVVSVYEDLNLGVIKLNEASDLPALPLGDSDGATVGHFAISVGNLGGQTNSVALLLIGAVNEKGMNSGSRYYPRLIQIAGTVGEGTSGAPLVDSKGEVIGMMVAVPVQTSSPNTIYIAPQRQTGVNVPSVPFVDFRTIPDESLSVTLAEPEGRITATDETVTQEGRPGSSLPLALPPGFPSDQDDKGTTLALPPRLPSGVEKPRAIPPAQGSRFPSIPRVTPATPRNYSVTYPFQNQRYLFGSTNQSYALGSASSAVTSAGFAVPINLLKSVITDIKAGKKVVRGWIGISPSDVTHTSDRGGGTFFTESYVVIDVIYPNSPAAIAGLRSGDILTKVDGKKITRASEVREISLNHRPGDKLIFTVERPGKEDGKRESLDITVIIQAKPEAIPNPAK